MMTVSYILRTILSPISAKNYVQTKSSGQGVSISQISKDLQVTERGVRKIISSYEETETIDPKLHLGQDHYKTTDIEYIKTQKPSTYGREIKDKHLDLGVCDNDTVPSRQTISHVLRHELGFTS